MTEQAPDSSAAPPAPVQHTWGLGDVGLGLVAGLVLSTLFGGLWLGLSGSDELSLAGRAFGQVGLWVGLVGCVVLASRRKGTGSLAADFGFSISRQDVLVGVIAALVAQFVVVPLVTIALYPLLGDPDVGAPVRDLVDSAGGVKAVGLVLMAAVGAPLVEELFFRGLVLRSLARRVGQVLAVVGSSVIFGVSHLNDLPLDATIVVMAGLSALGVVLAVLAVRTGRLGSAIVAHATFNAISLAFAFSR